MKKRNKNYKYIKNDELSRNKRISARVYYLLKLKNKIKIKW